MRLQRRQMNIEYWLLWNSELSQNSISQTFISEADKDEEAKS